MECSWQRKTVYLSPAGEVAVVVADKNYTVML